ncbi:MAG: F0F1 ATP synthase subunit epsilon [Deferribacteraceae bacterium]|jgi:F-type H+-transporting ATPase subunit epsilon|nr:F0F1 ATP synthase subunit epsilon [Deferribacteraceae bacterium]
MNKLKLELVSPERMLVSEEVDEIYVPGSEGDMGILPDHAALLTSLRAGEFRYRIGNETEYVAVDGGFLEVKDNKVVVLADGAELGREINLEEALRRKLEAETELEAARHKESVEQAAIEAELVRSILRISVADHYK